MHAAENKAMHDSSGTAPADSTSDQVKARLGAAFDAWAPPSGKRTKKALAERCEAILGQPCTPQTVNGWFSTGRMDKKWIPVLAKVLGVDLLTGALSAEQTNVEDAPTLVASRRVPVVGHVKGGVDGFLEEMQYPVGHGEGYVDYWTKDPGAYALRVKGDSMSPRYRAREFIVVTPSIEALPGNDVMVKLLDGRKMLKHLNWVRDNEIQLVSVNDGYAPMTVSMDEVESIQRVAGGVPSDAFQEAS